MFVYGVVGSIVADTPAYPAWYVFVRGFFVQSCGRPSLTGQICFVRGFGPKLLIPQPNWPDMFVYGDLCPKLWTPLPNWLEVSVHDNFHLK